MYSNFGLFSQQNVKSFNISEIVKAGSIGHGTTVPGHFDTDLVIYSRGSYVSLLLFFFNTLLCFPFLSLSHSFAPNTQM